MRSHLLPNLTGWSPEWHGGFPSYVAYPVLPALLIAAFSIFVPYGIAIKLIIVLACAGVPVATWAMGQLGKIPEPAPSLMALLSVAALLDNTSLVGATVQSALIGEYSEALAIVGAVALLLVDRRRRNAAMTCAR